MAREWKPGDVAMCDNGLAVVSDTCDRHFARGAHWHYPGGGWDQIDGPRGDPRPLVVLDPAKHWSSITPENAADRVAAFLREIEAMWGHDRNLVARNGGTGTLRWLAEAFEGVGTPPKPDEPTGLGAVVEDDEGRLYVRQHDGWWRGPEDGCSLNWAAVHAVRVLSEGVTA